MSSKSTSFEAFEYIHQVVFDRISDNMDSLVQYGKYGSIKTADTTTNVFYVIMFISEAWILQNDTTIDGKNISAGELVVKAQYLFSTKENTSWYWKQQPLKQNIIVPTRTILHLCLDVVGIKYVQDIPKDVCNIIQAKKSIQRHPIFMIDADYDYILYDIKCLYKIDFE